MILAMTVLLVGSMITEPAGAACCMVRASCCPEMAAPREDQSPGVNAPLPPCCRQMVSGVPALQCDRPTRVPSGKVIDMISAPPAAPIVLQASFVTSTPRTTPTASPDHDPPAARGPPRA